MKRVLKIAGLGLGGLILVLAGAIFVLGTGTFGDLEGTGSIEGTEPRPQAALPPSHAQAPGPDKQILFGDLHAHTTISLDAFFASLPLMGEGGTHPPADACDFARYCSALDFWSINDHSFSISPRAWDETVAAIRQCDAIAGDPANPDMVSFLGYEWTQTGKTRETHYGHKNIIFRGLGDADIPLRPIAARDQVSVPVPLLGVANLVLHGKRYATLANYMGELREMEACPAGVRSDQLPDGCYEQALTPADLFRKLHEGGHTAIVIPHGTAWGTGAPPGASWDQQLTGGMHDDEYQKLIEIYSGHGSSELHRPWRAVEIDADGTVSCPEPSEDYLPACWQAGELIRKRCLEAGESGEECEVRAKEARANWVEAGTDGISSVPGSVIDDWADAGQCRDCGFEPVFRLRPKSTAQYIAAIGNFDERDEEGRPRRFRLGFIASSDNHSARPGTGYKEFGRRGFMTDAIGVEKFETLDLLMPKADPVPYSVMPEATLTPFQSLENERVASYFYTGGLIAVRAAGRDRAAVWDALQRKETYATSGPRILLDFDMVSSDGSIIPMGGHTVQSQSPHFEVRALGSFKQKPGCPDYAEAGLSHERLQSLCSGECYNPSDTRRPITRIEVVRIRPQVYQGEPVADLIDDPFLVKNCPADGQGCALSFTDHEFDLIKRDTLYYVRAIEAPKPHINGGQLRCERDGAGNCIKIDPCHSDNRTPLDDECLADAEPHAWSSPIYVDWAENGSENGDADARD